MLQEPLVEVLEEPINRHKVRWPVFRSASIIQAVWERKTILIPWLPVPETNGVAWSGNH